MAELRTDAESLKYQLKLAGFSLAKVAVEVGVSRSLVSKVLHRSRRSEDVQKFVAKQLDTSVDELFGPDQTNMEVSDG
jgi:transcriptional regulator with XRE-family HTH domain